MKTVEDTRRRVRTWLDRNLTDRVATGNDRGLPVGLEPPTGKALQQQWVDAREWALVWRDVESRLPDGVTLEWSCRILGTAHHDLPSVLRISTLDAAASWVGGTYPSGLTTARARWALLHSTFPRSATTSILRAVTGWDHVDVDLLIKAAQWFAAEPVADDTWTPRQVPVPGLHAKWLDVTGRRGLIEQLAGIPTLRFRARPTQARVTYLDPGHAAAGKRRWDVLTAGDSYSPPYPPAVVVVVENRDTAFYFPPEVPGGVLVLGNGDAAVSLLTTARSLMDAPQLIYWGDIDAEGLRIVARLRAADHPVVTILMDELTYDTYAMYGTPTDQHGKPVRPGDPKPPIELTPAEAALYAKLTDPGWDGYRRIEQERIPLDVAVAAVLRSLVLAKGTAERSVHT